MSLTYPAPSGTPRPDLEFYRKAAKALLKEFRSGQPTATERLQAVLSPGDGTATLAKAQLAVARENGFPSWTKLKRHIEATNGTQPARMFPYVRDIQWYRDRAEGFLSAYQGGMQSTWPVIRQFLPALENLDDTELQAADFSLAEALTIQAKQHGFETWEAFETHIAALQNGQIREPFLLAFEAIEAGDISTLRQLLKEDSSLATAQGSNGNSLLNLAVSVRNAAACRMLLQFGASVNLGNNYGWTPLHQAAIGQDVSLLEKLLAAGGDLRRSARGEGGTPLVQALFWGNSVMADAIAHHDISLRNLRVAAGLGRLDLLQACFDAKGVLTEEAAEAREFYRPHGGFPEWSPSHNQQEILDEAFTYACRNGRTDVLEFLVQRGARLEGDPYRGTGLIWASYKDRWDTIRWLVEHGADINQQATFGGDSHGVGVTALHLAAQDGSLERVRFLIELGADPDIPDHLYNSTPIGWAEFLGNPEVAAYMLNLPQAGILNLATRGLKDRVAQILGKQPELVNGRPSETRHYPLHRSVENGHQETARLLLERGANPNSIQWDGKTALDIALEKGEQNIIQLLKEFAQPRE